MKTTTARSAAALARLRASGIRASAPGRRWNHPSGTPRFDFLRGCRPGTVVETFAGSNGAAGFDSPRSISPSATSSWDSTIARGDWRGSTTPTTRRDGASRVRGPRGGHTPRLVERRAFDLAGPPSPTLAAVFVHPHGARVGVVASRARSDRARRRARPLGAQKDKKAAESKTNANRRKATPRTRARRPTVRFGRARVALGRRASLRRTAAPRWRSSHFRERRRRASPLYPATQCRLRGTRGYLRLVVAPRVRSTTAAARASATRARDRDSRTRIRTRRAASRTAPRFGFVDSHAGDVAMQAIAAASAVVDRRRRREMAVRRLRASPRRTRALDIGTPAPASAREASSSSAVAAARAQGPLQTSSTGGRRGARLEAEETAATETSPPFATRAFARCARRLVRQRRSRRARSEAFL